MPRLRKQAPDGDHFRRRTQGGGVERHRSQTMTTGDGLRDNKSAGQLMKEVSEDLSTLVRKEIELAKQELGAAVVAKVKGAVVGAVVAFMAFFALIFLLLAVRDAFDLILPAWLADIVTAAILLVVAGAGGLIAKRLLTGPIKADLTKQ